MRRTASNEPLGCTNYKLRRVLRRISVLYESEMAAAGLKITQYSLLTHIEKLAPITQAMLADEMGMDASTLSRNLRPLIDAGWIEAEIGSDARSYVLSLTRAGLTKRTEAKLAWKRAQKGVNERLGTAQVAALHTMLDSITDTLEQDAA